MIYIVSIVLHTLMNGPNRLRLYRADRRVSQVELERITGIFQSRISDIERGVVRGSDDERGKLASALNATIDEVFPAEQVNA